MTELFEKFDIRPNNIIIYEEAFTHPSYANEYQLKENYQRLEFLGDSVLSIVVADYVYSNYNGNEGILTKIKTNYICGIACTNYAKNLDFDKYIRIKSNDNHLYISDDIYEDIFESFLGAVYMDQGFEKAQEVTLKIIVPYIESSTQFLFDYKAKLLELSKKSGRNVKYSTPSVKENKNNKQILAVTVRSGKTYIAEGTGHNRKEAEEQAARNVLTKYFNYSDSYSDFKKMLDKYKVDEKVFCKTVEEIALALLEKIKYCENEQKKKLAIVGGLLVGELACIIHVLNSIQSEKNKYAIMLAIARILAFEIAKDAELAKYMGIHEDLKQYKSDLENTLKKSLVERVEKVYK